ncbi:MAG: T9SS type A sorting domain-containing protein [Alphaproteobacteria bacterium]|nr:T9SS type A sorting domain-containing protein [Alphaproteobacteria bacterium]
MKLYISYLAKDMMMLIITIIIVNTVFADNLITSGTTLKVQPGTTLVSMDNLVIKNGATLSNSGTVVCKKNLTNENVSPNSLGSGTTEVSGTVQQTISGQNILTNLTVNNATGVVIGGNTAVNGNLTLTNGRVTLGSNNLTLGPLAAIVGTPSASMMIIVTGTGELRKEFPAGFSGTFVYPVGDDTGTPEYSPVTIIFTSPAFAPGNYVGVSLKNEKYPDAGITGNYLNRYWNLTYTGITNFLCNATFQYLTDDVVGTENKLSCSKVNPVPWITYGLTNAITHVLTANGLTALGSFTGLKSTTTPVNQELVNVVIPGGLTTCYDAQQILTVAGNGTTFIVENGGSVTLVAGNKISILNGAKVYSGGYLHGYITATGNFCGTMLAPLVASNQNGENVGMEEVLKTPLIKVYPNPTSDVVIVEVVGTNDNANITVYSMLGGKFCQRQLKGEKKYQFSLSDKPVGIYMVRVQAGDKSEIAKVVKK